MSDGDDTLRALSTGDRAGPAMPRLPCLTIAYHADPARVGERALLARQAGDRAIDLARSDLELADPKGERAPRPLEDPHLSRTPIRLRAQSEALLLEVPAKAGLRIDGAPSPERVSLGRDRLERGVVLELGKRVLLVAHLAEVGPRPPDHGLEGESDAIRAVRRAISRVADLDVPVLIRGETGVGKERVAQAIHAASHRNGDCVAVNVATLPSALAASELFGHARGAFTGANAARTGIFERASGGTLFLDEIGELADELQTMLLRVLETGRVRKLGEHDERDVDARVIAATDASLEAAVEAGRFRAALYHRLRGFEITVPPLRARREDVARLLVTLLRDELERTGEQDRLTKTGTPWIDRSLVAKMIAYDWPGNVRELRGVARQLVVTSRGEPTLRADDAVLRALGPTPAREVERGTLRSALEAHGFSFAKAAKALGLSRSALYRLAQDDPDLRTGGELGREELERCLREHDGDLDAVAARLRLSKRALKLRMRALGL